MATIDAAQLTLAQRLELLRALQLILIRLGGVNEETRLAMLSRLEPAFPSGSDPLDRELVLLLSHLESPVLASRVVTELERQRPPTPADYAAILERNRGYGATIAAMLENQPDLQQIHLAFAVRKLRAGWSPELRQSYFRWFQKAQGWKGGASYEKFLFNAAKDAYALCSDQERFMLEASGVRKPVGLPPELPTPQGPGQAYTAEELTEWANGGLKARDFERGKRMYAAARCIVCHRYGGEGGATGPDLTQVAGRFSAQDLIDAMVHPSRVISDQYKSMMIQTRDGTVISGRVIQDISGKVTIAIDPEDASKIEVIEREEIEQEKVSAISQMPAELLNKLNRDEVMDLLAYLLSRGDAGGPAFVK